MSKLKIGKLKRQPRQRTYGGVILSGKQYLSKTYANTKTNFKVVDPERIIGFSVDNGVCYPLYEAVIWRWEKKPAKNSVTYAYERGEYLVDHRPMQLDENDDYLGKALVRTASSALGALVERQARGWKFKP